MPEDTAREPTARSLIGSIALTRMLQIPLLVAALLAVYVEGTSAFVNTEEAIKAKAVADNATLKQKSEGEVAEQTAATALQVARNAAERQKAEAEKAEADAQKAVAEAITARATAQNAQTKARADALTIKAEAELRKQKYIVALETARNAARRQQAEADKIEATVVGKKQTNAMFKRQLDQIDCPKGFASALNELSKTNQRRNGCGNN